VPEKKRWEGGRWASTEKVKEKKTFSKTKSEKPRKRMLKKKKQKRAKTQGELGDTAPAGKGPGKGGGQIGGNIQRGKGRKEQYFGTAQGKQREEKKKILVGKGQLKNKKKGGLIQTEGGGGGSRVVDADTRVPGGKVGGDTKG